MENLSTENPLKLRKPIFPFLFLLLLLLFPGCRKEDTGLLFNHSRHAVHTPACNECHLEAGDDVVKAGHLHCRRCHEIDEKKPSTACLLCHDNEKEPKGASLERPDYSDVDMDHEVHAGGGVVCKACHGEVSKRERLSTIDFIAMEACVKCHFPAGYPSFDVDCGFCHSDMDKNTPPKSHGEKEWIPEHGTDARKRDALCRRCHQSNSCDTCHRTTPPSYHTVVFKKRGHGIRAAGFPDKCEVCHQQDFCIFCHRSADPTYHTPLFKTSRPYTHCGMCHLPVDTGNRCRACHTRASHDTARATATPPPPFVNKSLPCLPCHPVGLVPIRHLYNTIPGTECTFCHI